MIDFRETATKEMKDNYQGIIQTVWTSADNFMEGYYGNKKDKDGGDNTDWNSLKAIFVK
jgi:hypothetical protein